MIRFSASSALLFAVACASTASQPADGTGTPPPPGASIDGGSDAQDGGDDAPACIGPFRLLSADVLATAALHPRVVAIGEDVYVFYLTLAPGAASSLMVSKIDGKTRSKPIAIVQDVDGYQVDTLPSDLYAVAAAGGGFAIAWRKPPNLVLGIFSADGAPHGTPTVLDTYTSATVPGSLGVTSSGGDLMVSWVMSPGDEIGGQGRFRRVSASSGAPVVDAAQTLGYDLGSVAPTSHGFTGGARYWLGVSYVDGAKPYFFDLASDGSLVGNATKLADTKGAGPVSMVATDRGAVALRWLDDVSGAWDGHAVGLVGTPADAPSKLVFTRLPLDGGDLDAPVTLATDATNDWTARTFTSLAWTGRAYAAVWGVTPSDPAAAPDRFALRYAFVSNCP